MKVLCLVTLSILLSACGGASMPNESKLVETLPPVVATQLIKINQLGFAINSSKVAIVPNLANKVFKVIDVTNNEEVFSGQLSSLSTWSPSGEQVSTADFSALTTEGEYHLEIEGIANSNSFVIASNVLSPVHDAAIKAYYYNRASTELLAEHAGDFVRAAGHLDTNVLVHASAASIQRPEGSVISAPKGWYDAGDFGKYVVNSGISTYTLLTAYEHFSEFYQHRELNIPESGDEIPDLLDEVKWNLDWLQAMQDPNDGGVYHKLTTLNFSGTMMPNQADAQRYVIQKGTAATLNFSAVMAVASRLYKNYDTQFNGLSEQYRQAAISAWQWAKINNNIVYNQPDDVHTGAYGDSNFTDEFSWAAAELYLLTAEEQYLTYFKDNKVNITTPSWSDTSALGYLSLVANGKTAQSLLSSDDYERFSQKIKNHANKLVQQYQQSAYGVAMTNNDFVWGSNGHAMNKAMVLLQAYRITPNSEYKAAALGLVDYVLGRNPTNYSFVTGFGSHPVMNIHHRQSESDQVVAPVPGFLSGGPHNGKQDGCIYPSNLQAKSFLDDYCSYSTNEVTINWNAPLVYVLAGLQVL
ncbi:MAG: glycoside hydrolase family 9 protein [Colwellia sp.]